MNCGNTAPPFGKPDVGLPPCQPDVPYATCHWSSGPGPRSWAAAGPRANRMSHMRHAVGHRGQDRRRGRQQVHVPTGCPICDMPLVIGAGTAVVGGSRSTCQPDVPYATCHWSSGPGPRSWAAADPPANRMSHMRHAVGHRGRDRGRKRQPAHLPTGCPICDMPLVIGAGTAVVGGSRSTCQPDVPYATCHWSSGPGPRSWAAAGPRANRMSHMRHAVGHRGRDRARGRQPIHLPTGCPICDMPLVIGAGTAVGSGSRPTCQPDVPYATCRWSSGPGPRSRAAADPRANRMSHMRHAIGHRGPTPPPNASHPPHRILPTPRAPRPSSLIP